MLARPPDPNTSLRLIPRSRRTVMHGLGSSHTFYQAALSLSSLKQKYRVIRYDFDGHGLSPFSGARSFSIDSLVEDLRELMDDCDVRAAAGIVGHSMSGLVATSFAAKYPDRVQKLCSSALGASCRRDSLR